MIVLVMGSFLAAWAFLCGQLSGNRRFNQNGQGCLGRFKHFICIDIPMSEFVCPIPVT